MLAVTLSGSIPRQDGRTKQVRMKDLWSSERHRVGSGVASPKAEGPAARLNSCIRYASHLIDKAGQVQRNRLTSIYLRDATALRGFI